jgi:hypothetical protein
MSNGIYTLLYRILSESMPPHIAADYALQYSYAIGCILAVISTALIVTWYRNR